LPTTTALIRGTTAKERARDLAKSGRTASAGTVWRFLSNMLYNGEEMLRARAIQRKMKQQEKQDKEDKEQNAMEELFQAADKVFNKYFDDHEENISALGRDDLYTLIKFICKIENKPKDAPSSYKNMNDVKKRLMECKPHWTKYFQPLDDDENEDEDDDNMNNEKDNANQNS